MNILLICANGMSTSLLVEKMKKAAELKKIEDITIVADSIDNLDSLVTKYDVILLGPQIKYKEQAVSKVCAAANKPYRCIPPMVYGMVNGEKTLELALEAVQNQ